MAASQVKSVGGYRCEFIDPVSDDFICKVCNCVAREPNLTFCCGQHYCQSCIMKIVEDGKPCPNPECGEATFNAVLDKNYHRKILALRVHCTMKERGCQWMGKVEQLDTHIDVNTGDCQYVDIECPEKCGQQVQKIQLATHIANECPKRDFTCMYCDFKAIYEVVSEKHWPECQNYPVPCPNRCQIGAVERNTLEDHLNMCSLQVIECDFSYAGCNEKLQRQDMEKHVEQNTQKHLALMAAASMKTNQELQEQRDEFRGYVEQKERETAEKLKQKDEFEKLKNQQDEFRGYLEQKERETAEQLKKKDVQIKVVEERLQQSVREKEEQIKSMRKSLQKVQKGEQQLQQQLEQKERQINHIQVKQVQEKQQLIEALRAQVVQVKEVHEKQIKAVEERLRQSVEEQIESMRKTLQKEHEKQIKALKEQIVQVKQDHEKSLEVQSQQQVERIGKLEKQLKEKEQELEQLYMKLGMPPLHFTMSNFNHLKTKKTDWESPPMYTHPHGYKFCIRVEPNVVKDSSSHVAVRFYSMSGEFDATLQWPARFTITLQLLNQHRDQDHITKTAWFQWKKPEREREFVGYLPSTLFGQVLMSSRLGTIVTIFITHADLELNTQKQTQYLKDDCLRFRITKIN